MLSQWELAEAVLSVGEGEPPKIKRVPPSRQRHQRQGHQHRRGEALKALGFEVAATVLRARDKDFYPVLTKILAQKPDMLDVAAAPPARPA